MGRRRAARSFPAGASQARPEIRQGAPWRGARPGGLQAGDRREGCGDRAPGGLGIDTGGDSCRGRMFATNGVLCGRPRRADDRARTHSQASITKICLLTNLIDGGVMVKGGEKDMREVYGEAAQAVVRGRRGSVTKLGKAAHTPTRASKGGERVSYPQTQEAEHVTGSSIA